MAEEKIEKIVSAWFAGEFTMFDECTEEPELAWQAILQILKSSLTDEQMSLLAAGPLETLLAWHGQDFIDRVVQEASINTAFKRLLGGVWRQDMPQNIWDRIEKARGEAW